MKRARSGGDVCDGDPGGGAAPPAAYFTGYDDHLVHRKMLADGARVSAYARAMAENAEARFKGKVVMDVRVVWSYNRPLSSSAPLSSLPQCLHLTPLPNSPSVDGGIFIIVVFLFSKKNSPFALSSYRC